MSVDNFNLKLNSKIKPFRSVIKVDSDKSISIRSFLLTSISNNISTAKNVLESEDVLSTIKCLKKLGVRIKKTQPKNYQIYGKGLGSLFIKKNEVLNFGNSGTLARLLIGMLSTTPGINVVLKGDHSLNKRNMMSLIKLLENYGAEFTPKNKFYFPLKITSSNFPIGINYEAGSSAQLKSAAILAGLNSFGTTEIIEKNVSREHTENMLKNNKQAFKLSHKKIKKIQVFGKKYLNKFDIKVPGDPSSAAFFTALTLLNDNSNLVISNVGLDSRRIGFYELLKKSGGKIKFRNLRKTNNERIGDIQVASSKLKPIIASNKYYLNATDEYPILFTMAALIKGKSSFDGISGLRNKESDRIKEMQKILRQIGIRSNFNKNRLVINGSERKDYSKKIIKVSNLGDHRICMSSAILALLTGTNAVIKNFETVGTSSPNFLKIIESIGGKFEKKY
mgnify:CR=1 FL=1